MEKTAVKNLSFENGKACTLKYSVLESVVSDEEGRLYTGYGIRVEKFYDDALVEFAEFENITVKTIEITELFMLLSNGTVMPCTLGDVIEEYLSVKYS